MHVAPLPQDLKRMLGYQDLTKYLSSPESKQSIFSGNTENIEMYGENLPDITSVWVIQCYYAKI